MSLWVGISPLIGVGSLEGFAVGAATSAAFFLTITALRRMRRRQAAAAGARGVSVSAGGAEVGGLDAGLRSLEALGPEAERVAQSQPAQDDQSQPVAQGGQSQPGAQIDQLQPVAQGDQLQLGARDDQFQPGAPDDAGCTAPTGRDGRAAAYRSRHRLGDPIPGRVAHGGASADRTRRSIAFPHSTFPGWASRDDAQLGSPFPDAAPCDAAFPDGTFRSARRPEVRRLPRHAAPTVSFGTKVSGRVTGLFAAWPLAGGAPS